jgi:hypothetical protein
MYEKLWEFLGPMSPWLSDLGIKPQGAYFKQQSAGLVVGKIWQRWAQAVGNHCRVQQGKDMKRKQVPALPLRGR